MGPAALATETAPALRGATLGAEDADGFADGVEHDDQAHDGVGPPPLEGGVEDDSCEHCDGEQPIEKCEACFVFQDRVAESSRGQPRSARSAARGVAFGAQGTVDPLVMWVRILGRRIRADSAGVATSLGSSSGRRWFIRDCIVIEC